MRFCFVLGNDLRPEFFDGVEGGDGTKICCVGGVPGPRTGKVVPKRPLKLQWMRNGFVLCLFFGHVVGD